MDLARTRAFIDDRFARAYGARNCSSFTDYLTLEDGHRRAALGYRRARAENLFVERYLGQPVEQAVSIAFGRKVERDRIVEIGNLAADNAWSMLALWGEAANDLGGSNEVAVATLTAPLRRMFIRIGVSLHYLAVASPLRLGAAAADWGSYYQNDPRVCASSIAEAHEAIRKVVVKRGSRTS